MKARIGAIAVTGIALLLWGSNATAGSSSSGTERVRAKNTRTRTIQLGDRQSGVEGYTVISDPRGNQISLADLMVPDLAPGGGGGCANKVVVITSDGEIDSDCPGSLATSGVKLRSWRQR